MKCSYCGNELEKGAEFCPECGMILGLNETRDDKKSSTSEPEFKVPEYTPNVFRAIDIGDEEPIAAMELEADDKEEIVPVTENIPEFVSQVPEYTPAEISDTVEETVEDTAANEQTLEVQADETSEDFAEEEVHEPQTATEELPVEAAVTEVLSEETELSAPEYVPAPDMPKEDDLNIRVPESEITYPEYEKYKNEQQENEAIDPTEDSYEEIDADDIYVEPGKKKNGVLAVFLVIAVICVVIGGVYAVKNIIPVSGGEDTTTTKAQQAGIVSQEDTTEAEETTDTEDTTDLEETTEEDNTAAADETTQAEETTDSEDAVTTDGTEEVTTDGEEEEVTTTQETTTKAPTTTAVTTTKAAATTTTAAATTTKAPNTTTTKPASTTTDPYGINDVEVKKPSSYFEKTYILYCTEEGVILRNKPSSSSERVLYLSKGADLTVLAKENGFYYVRSNRYGVNGWVSSSYTAKERPTEETTKVYKNTVSPDKKYGDVEVKYTTDGLNIRKGPGTDYDVVSLIPKNYPVKVIGYKKGVSGWVYVTDTTYGISGWVSSAYLK